MDHAQDFKSMQEQIQAALISITRSAGQLSSEDLGFQRTLNPEIGTSLDEQSARLLLLSNKLLKSAASIAEIKYPTLEDVDDVENDWRGVVDVVDSLLEKADGSLDEYTGVIKRTSSPAVDQNATTKSKKSPWSLGTSFRTQNLLKPQLGFQVKADNQDTTPWKPLLKTKPNASKSLEDSLGMFTDELDHPQYQHPYETEILNLQYPDQVYQTAEPITYLPVETTSATFVDTYEAVLEMLEELKSAKEIAIDLEHHDARSYVGLVSLMQVSTRSKDWIVDTLKPWRQDLQVLNEVFTDPKIVKVFHGAFMDIVWLQRDLGLYVTGLFDTHHACRVLGYPGGSLAYLLKRFIDFDADKKFQMADWRIRPLPEEMFFYARADTHFLLYIYDNLRNELIEKSNPLVPEENKLEQVLQKSKETSLLRFERQLYDTATGKGPGGWFSVLVKTPALLSNQQFAVFRAVHGWRDEIARADDDSTNFVMPNHVVNSIAKNMPTDLVALYATVHPISHNVKSRIGELLEVVKTAVAQGAEPDAPHMMDFLKPNSVGAIAKANGLSRSSPSASAVPTATVDDGPLRSEKSTFWGGAFGSSIWESPSAIAQTNSDIKLAIPLPQLAPEAFSDSMDLTHRATPIKQVITTTEQYTPVTTEDEAFVIKAGSKRKSDAISSVPTTDGEYDISLNEEEIAAANEKAARKVARKAEKKAEKARKRGESSGLSTPLKESTGAEDQDEEMEDEEADEQPFDYSKAESVLNSKQARAAGAGERGTKKKRGGVGGAGLGHTPFDPYKKSENAAKGMRRVQSERSGKSFTFKK